MFTLSQRSLRNLEGVDGRLVAVVKYAIQYTPVDFGVICGVRTGDQQKVLFDKGASKTMDSKHLTGEAVDLLAYVGARGSWELSLYDEIAETIRTSARVCGVGIRWGAAWHVPDIRMWCGTMGGAMNEYIDMWRAQGKRPFIDAPHFELAG